jgi:hypothetical protein
MTSKVTLSEGEQCSTLPENPHNLPVHPIQPNEHRIAEHPEEVEIHIYNE